MQPPNLRYEPRGKARDLIESRAPEILISGPAGTGKSIACLWKLHYCCWHIPNLRALIVRQTRASLTESALVTFEQNVVAPEDPLLEGPQKSHRQAYHYPNGSHLAVGGLDKPGKIMSSEWDMVYVQEAIELSEEAWEAITTRLRNNKLPYQQLLADTNPDAPTHWLKRRCDAGRTVMLDSRHEDNPTLWDEEKQAWTDFAHKPDGTGYIQVLENLTGPRLQRLRHGRWVQAEGVVYDGWDRGVHLIDRFDVPASWVRYLVVDFGYTNPFVCQFWAADPDGRLYLYREIYHTQRLVEDHAGRIKELLVNEPKPVAVVCDHDAEDRATLERHLGYSTIAAKKEVSPGIQAVASRLRKAGDGRARLFVMRDARDQLDQGLANSKKPTCTAEEWDGYVWDTANNRKKGEEPVKKDDHGMDSVRYLVMHVDGPKKTVTWW